MQNNRMADGVLNRPVSECGAEAHVDRDGGLVTGDVRIFDLVRAGRPTVAVPGAGRTGWLLDGDARTAVEIRPSGDGFVLSEFVDVATDLTSGDLDRVDSANFVAVTQTNGLDAAVRLMCSDFAKTTGLVAPTLVLIDRDGSPTFAGGLVASHEALVAMERTRRNGAPMAIWQAFSEDRVILDPRWFQVARRDERFAPVSSMFGDGRAEGTFVAVPLHIDNRPVGVLSGVHHDLNPLGPSSLLELCVLADRIMLAIRYSEAIRRSQAKGANAERSRIHENLHATIAQDAFVLSLEVARVNAVADEGIRTQLLNLDAMSERLLTDVRAAIEDAPVADAGTDVDSRIHHLAQDARNRSAAAVHVELDADWDILSSSFGDDILHIVAEGLRNAVKHGAPSQITLRAVLERDTGWLRLSITDEGDGQRESPQSTGVGLNLVRRLVEQRGGTVEIRFESGGATLAVEMPAEYESEWAVAQRFLEGSD
jgi:signal transduction histidine kinase